MSNEMTIDEFCDNYDACNEGRQWAMENCTSMSEAWAKLKPEWLIWVATQKGVLTDKELRLFAVWSARQVQHLMKDHRSITALDVAERHASGQATDEELYAAMDAARAAAWAAARAAARAAAWDAERAAAWAAAGDAQAAWLRANTNPNFKRQ